MPGGPACPHRPPCPGCPRFAAPGIPADARALLAALCGAIGLGLLPRVARLLVNEVAPAGLQGLALGLAARPDAERARAAVLPGPAGDHAATVSDADVVLVDPPRRGLDDAVLEALCRDPPARVIAVSCNPRALLREARTLQAARRLRLVALTPYALFPHTAHVETLARFDRAS